MKIKRKLLKAQWRTKQWALGKWVIFPDLGEWQGKVIKQSKS